MIERSTYASVGDKLYFAGERLGYTVQAARGRYAVCSKPFNPKRTVLYCIVDFEAQVRGPEGVVFGMGAETRADCESMLTRVCSGRSDISYRHRAKLAITKYKKSAPCQEHPAP